MTFRPAAQRVVSPERVHRAAPESGALPGGEEDVDRRSDIVEQTLLHRQLQAANRITSRGTLRINSATSPVFASPRLRTWRITKDGLKEVQPNTMGAFLDKPKTEKTNDNGEGNGLRYAVGSMQGWRIDMEDAHQVSLSISDEPPFDKWSFFAVFDGHAGSYVAKNSAENLLKTILEEPYFKQGVENVKRNNNTLTEEAKSLLESGIRDGFLSLDAKLRSEHDEEGKERSGTTAICALITPENIFFANLGDSRAIGCRKDGKQFATQDHKPYLDKERERIVKAGGSVMIERVNGSLAVSRALGDFCYKSVPGLEATEQLVSPEPDIYVLDRSKDEDEFVVLACDGIYDVLENADLCSVVRSRLSVSDNLPEIVNQVLDAALAKGSRDNMTLILVAFEGAPKPDLKLIEEEKKWFEEVETHIQAILTEHDARSEAGDQMPIDADKLTRMLHSRDIKDTPLHGIYLARPLIDRILKTRESNQQD
ncbi:hypothetical protein QR680_005050 [Steinernema hermaphroditum]|uniref:PPM-type phosphatase domain-containing protein n=1 Tax=Steinernema hermaphroditum TaxID=289476 RepID=A0AA39LUN6_9BILA|nr:hypothetical protein QR680_005050 [Steinernema hermaphroditum]